MQRFDTAMKLLPDNLKIQYWASIKSANAGNIKKASSMLKAIYVKEATEY